MRRAFQSLVVSASASIAMTSAAAGRSPPDPRSLSANPDSAVASVVWRSQLRAKAGLVIPLVAPDGGGFALRVPGFIELHNVHGSAIPSELWRGRIAADASYGFHLRAFGFRTGAALEHESDHTSIARYVGFLNLNSLALRLDGIFDLGHGLSLFASSVNRIHLHTCTRSSAYCAIEGGSRGARAFEVAGDATLSRMLTTAFFGDLRAFLSLHAAWLLPHAIVLEEQRLTGDLGVALTTTRQGTFQFLFTMLGGTDVGLLRGRNNRLLEAGFAIRWSPN